MTVQAEKLIEGLADQAGPLAIGIALHMLGDRSQAEDAVQDAFERALRAAGSLRDPASARSWFLRIVVNSCRRERVVVRRWIRRREETGRALVQAHAEPTETDPPLRARLGSAVRRLPLRQRAAFVLRYVHGLGIDDMATVLGCAPGTVKATIHKAVVKLRRELGDIER